MEQVVAGLQVYSGGRVRGTGVEGKAVGAQVFSKIRPPGAYSWERLESKSSTGGDLLSFELIRRLVAQQTCIVYAPGSSHLS